LNRRGLHLVSFPKNKPLGWLVENIELTWYPLHYPNLVTLAVSMGLLKRKKERWLQCWQLACIMVWLHVKLVGLSLFVFSKWASRELENYMYPPFIRWTLWTGVNKAAWTFIFPPRTTPKVPTWFVENMPVTRPQYDWVDHRW
jgi:hypothetical protein